ncbi:aldo/keto reductase [Halobacteria archaeon AArc-m2/3/4]|uniref:Aldo/keto reductase n=1 Tax=Natronoglomus mannanivorans TaxID=2979990 RepID=A0AAP2Z545_9EURY|nr:aldo/keto reductase [Halobacteria archaeon AArc-xg1-1]MCU4975788.1 aldo/keto reductase [Halobacteria archaeon AArc-m2/3/4]
MEYTKLGSTGTDVSQLCFGTWRFAKESDGVVETDREEAHELLDAAWENGINFIDTANVYGDPSGTSEEWIGEWLADRDREEFVVASKVYGDMGDGPNEGGLSRKHIRSQIDGTLERLGTDYLDVYYIHRWDDETPIEETLSTLDGLVREGKVNHLGASMTFAWQLTKALWTSDVNGWERFEVTQPRYNAAFRGASDMYEIDVGAYVDVCADQDLAVCPYSPLEGGFLTGKYERDASAPDGSRGDLQSWEEFSDQQWDVLEAITAVADEVDAMPAQVSLRWLMEREFSCVPIVGARTVEQLEENAAAADVSLSADQLERIDEAY